LATVVITFLVWALIRNGVEELEGFGYLAIKGSQWFAHLVALAAVLYGPWLVTMGIRISGANRN